MTAFEPYQNKQVGELIEGLSKLPPTYFRPTLKLIEAQLEHEYDIEKLRTELLLQKERNSHQLFTRGLAAGFVIVTGMVAASVVVGVQGHLCWPGCCWGRAPSCSPRCSCSAPSTPSSCGPPNAATPLPFPHSLPQHSSPGSGSAEPHRDRD
ncbi:hypothetical protein [Acrocarpospora sp. B8E8]|uniref:hypothetical protein n=1 Tax=Acrocarpospora sp. B8E8 TaxID=3153572 RepID=UPI00325EE955